MHPAHDNVYLDGSYGKTTNCAFRCKQPVAITKHTRHCHNETQGDLYNERSSSSSLQIYIAPVTTGTYVPNWGKVLRPIQHQSGHLGDAIPSQSLGKY